MHHPCRAGGIWPAFTSDCYVTKHSGVKTLVLTACYLTHCNCISVQISVFTPCRRLPVLPQENVMSSEVLGLPEHISMPEDLEQAVPLAEPDIGCDSEAGNAQQDSYDLWPTEPVYGPRGFDGDQIKQLYQQLRHHCQLCVEVYALTACNSNHQEAAVTIFNLFAEYQVGVCSIVGVQTDFAI